MKRYISFFFSQCINHFDTGQGYPDTTKNPQPAVN